MRRLVNLLLMVLIAGTLVVVISIVLALKPFVQAASEDRPVVAGLGAGERLVRAEATTERITLLIEGKDGARRVVILDARTYQPVGELGER